MNDVTQQALSETIAPAPPAQSFGTKAPGEMCFGST
jgi:hypothetical protein